MPLWQVSLQLCCSPLPTLAGCSLFYVYDLLPQCVWSTECAKQLRGLVAVEQGKVLFLPDVQRVELCHSAFWELEV